MLAPTVAPWLRLAAAGPVVGAIHGELAARPDAVAAFYQARGDRPFWFEGRRARPEAAALIQLLAHADRDDLTPQTYQLSAVASALQAAKSGQAADVARADLMLTQAFAAYGADLHTPPPNARLAFADPAIALPPTDVRGVLAEAARAPSTAAALADAERMNPIYQALRAALAAARAGPQPDGHAIAALRINLARARALPADLGERYILVNPAAEKLWLYQGGQLADTMPVVVGKLSDQTPAMIGLLRDAVLDPYWYVPPDLARARVAPEVLANGPEYLAGQGLEVLSDWSDNASPVPPDTVDWRAVADGQATVRLRQQPGPGNMMGQVKFVLANPLGVYLHDTPLKNLFDQSQRADSAGCVRLANAAELGERLFGHALAADPARGPEQRVDLTTPVPVYILYLTAQPDPAGGVQLLPDIYGRDAPLLAAIGYRQNSQASEPAPASTQ